jgi:hypothetical protein
MLKMKSAIPTKICGGCTRCKSDSTHVDESDGMHILEFHRLILSILLIFYGCVVGTRLQRRLIWHRFYSNVYSS